MLCSVAFDVESPARRGGGRAAKSKGLLVCGVFAMMMAGAATAAEIANQGSVDGAAAAALPTAATDTTTYLWDDGTAEDALGLTAGGTMLFLNDFTVANGAEYISEVSAVIGPTIPGGTSFTMMVYDDPNNDGVPGDAVLIRTVEGTVANQGEYVFQTLSVLDQAGQPVYVGAAGDHFFVAAMVSAASGLYPAAIDQSSSAGHSWLAATTGQFDTGNLLNNEFPIASVASYGWPANFLVRASTGSGRDYCDEPELAHPVGYAGFTDMDDFGPWDQTDHSARAFDPVKNVYVDALADNEESLYVDRFGKITGIAPVAVRTPVHNETLAWTDVAVTGIIRGSIRGRVDYGTVYYRATPPERITVSNRFALRGRHVPSAKVRDVVGAEAWISMVGTEKYSLTLDDMRRGLVSGAPGFDTYVVAGIKGFAATKKWFVFEPMEPAQACYSFADMTANTAGNIHRGQATIDTPVGEFDPGTGVVRVYGRIDSTRPLKAVSIARVGQWRSTMTGVYDWKSQGRADSRTSDPVQTISNHTTLRHLTSVSPSVVLDIAISPPATE